MSHINCILLVSTLIHTNYTFLIFVYRYVYVVNKIRYFRFHRKNSNRGYSDPPHHNRVHWNKHFTTF